MRVNILDFAENYAIKQIFELCKFKPATNPKDDLAISQLADYIESLSPYVERDAAQISLLQSIMISMDDNGMADSYRVKALHSAVMHWSMGSAADKITSTQEYSALYEKGFIYEVLRLGKQRCLKFQHPYSDALKSGALAGIKELLAKNDILKSNNKNVSEGISKSHLYNKTEPTENSAMQMLFRRINREFPDAAYIGDIKINDEEYAILKQYLKKALENLDGNPDDAMYAVAVVQVAMRTYREHVFWGNFFAEADVPSNASLQGIIGKKFWAILIKHNKFHTDSKRYIQNILMHCYVSDYYAPKYFDFLYKFYSIDLDRDISRLDQETMNILLDSVCSEDNTGRRYMLVQHTSQAVAANRPGAAVRIRRHLEQIDKLFWNPEYEIIADHRLDSLMQDWARSANELALDANSIGRNHGRGARRFSSPYIFFDKANASFQLVLPSQIVKWGGESDLYWEISGAEEICLETELTESVTGYKVLQTSTPINWHSVLGKFRIRLTDNGGIAHKTFYITESNIRFFDCDGYPVNANALKTEEIIAVSQPEDILLSSALTDSYVANGLLFSCFDFEYEDILRLPDGKAVIVGKKEIQSGLAGKGYVEAAVCTYDDNECRLYREMPHLVLRMQPQKAAGTCIEINGQRFKLFDTETVEFSIDDRSGETGYYINLAFLGAQNGLYEIMADIPGGAVHRWKFVLVKDFEAVFDGAPYVFEPRGTVSFNDSMQVIPLSAAAEQVPGTNDFKFEIERTGRRIEFELAALDKPCIVSLPVPAVFIKAGNDNWSSRRPPHMWHKDFPDIIELSVPYHKVSLSMEHPSSDDGGRRIEYGRNMGSDSIVCDVRRFKSYLSGDGNLRQLRMSFAEVDTDLFNILIRSIVTSCDIIGNFENDSITINANIIGQAQYCFDLYHNGALIADKAMLDNGTATLFGLAKNGRYTVELFEEEADTSGFEDAYYSSLGKYEQQLLNPYDMSDRSFRIIQIENKENGTIYPLMCNFYVEHLKKVDANIYCGTMVAEKRDGTILAAFPINVEFPDLKAPGLLWISFADEYGDKTEFLYDTRRKVILKEENPALRKLECYRRYSVLNQSEEIFRVEFCDRAKCAREDIPNTLVFEETSNVFSFANQRQSRALQEKNNRSIKDISWKGLDYEFLKAAGIHRMGQIVCHDRNSFKRLIGAAEESIDRIERTLAAYGYSFAKAEASIGSAKAYATSFASKEPIEKASVILPAPDAWDEVQVLEPCNDEYSTSTEEAAPKDTRDIKVSHTMLPPMTYNCLKTAGHLTVGDVLELYLVKGKKGLENIPRSTAEMRQQIMDMLKHYELI